MKLFYKKLFASVLTAGMVFASPSALAAEPDERKQVDSIRPAIQQEFELDMQLRSEDDRLIYGLSASESFADVTLGEGRIYYTVSEEDLEKKTEGEVALSLGGYLFPMLVSGRNIGLYLVHAKSFDEFIMANNHRLAVQLNNRALEQDIESAKKLVGDDSSEVKLIYDDSFHIYAFAAWDGAGYDLIPFWANGEYGLVKEQKTPLLSITDLLREEFWFRKNNPMMLGGGPGGQTIPHGNAVYYAATVLFLAVLGLGVSAVSCAIRKQETSINPK